MASSKNSGVVLQSYLTPEFASEVRQAAADDNRTVSNFVKLALQDRLQTTSSAVGSGGDTASGSAASSLFPATGADS